MVNNPIDIGVDYWYHLFINSLTRLNVMSRIVFRRKLLRLGYENRSIAVTLPKAILEHLEQSGYDISDYAEIELGDDQELILRLSRAKN